MNESNALVAYQELSVVDVQNQVAKIQDLMKSLMKDGEHYGIIPGTQKPSLLKPGAEKLCFIFRLTACYDVTVNDLPNGHREISVKCTLKHMGTGEIVGEGVGSCSTMESKYRYRNQEVKTDVGPVTKDYWALPKDDPKAREQYLVKLYGPGKYRAKKADGEWRVFKIEGEGEKIENPDIADVYNTVLKMAKKRAHVDATLSACAASDIFTQDVEDTVPEGVTPPKDVTPPAPPTPAPEEGAETEESREWHRKASLIGEEVKKRFLSKDYLSALRERIKNSDSAGLAAILEEVKAKPLPDPGQEATAPSPTPAEKKTPFKEKLESLGSAGTPAAGSLEADLDRFFPGMGIDKVKQTTVAAGGR